MPNPLTGQPWPWETQTAPQDTSKRDAAVKQISDQITAGGGRGELIGSPSPTLDKNGKAVQGGWQTYTFADGSTADVNPDGQVTNVTLANPPSAQQQQQNAGILDFGANGVWTKDPATGKWGPSVSTQNKEQLSGAQQVAQTGVYQGQGNLYNQQAGVVGSNAAAQQGLQGAQAGLYGQQAGVVAGNAAAQQTLQNAQAGLYGQQANVVGGNAAAQQGLQNAQAGLYGQQAGVVAGNAAATQSLQNAQAGLYGVQAQTAPLTAAAQAGLYNAQAGLYGAQAQAYPGTAAAQQQLYGAQAANQAAQAAAALNPAQLTVNLSNQANQMAASLQQQAQQGKITPDQAASQFDAWYASNVEPMKQQIAYQQAVQQQTLATQQAQVGLYQAQAANYPAALAQTASNDAQSNAIKMMPYMVNANAAANPGITTGARGFPVMNPGQIMQNATFSLPNLQEIGRQGAAAALANISPTAAMHAQMPGPPGQPPAQGLPSLASMLNLNNYGFGAPQQAAGPINPMTGRPAQWGNDTAGWGPGFGLNLQNVVNTTGQPGGAQVGGAAMAAPAAPPAAPAPPPFDWAGLLARQQQSAQDQAAQAQFQWPAYQPAA